MKTEQNIDKPQNPALRVGDVSGSLLIDKANEYAKFIYDEGYNDPMYQPEVTQSIVDFKAGFNSCVVLLRKAYELIPDGTSHENLIEIKQVLFSNGS
jgi:hypothetical protein